METSGLKKLHLQPSPEGNAEVNDPAKLLADLSPTSQASACLLLQSLRKKEAEIMGIFHGKRKKGLKLTSPIIGQDAQHRPVIQYKDDKSKKLWWDASNANMITTPRTDSDVQQKMEACMELIDYLKKNKPPSGVVIDPSYVKTKHGHYREGKEFSKTTEVLGKGHSAGDIIVVKDNTTGKESAQKTMMISVFRNEEIQAWVDLNETGVPPALYSFHLQGNQIHINMEKIQNGITLRDVIDTHMASIRTVDPALARPFSLYMFNGILSAVNLMHERGWTHRDLHAGNIMLEATVEGVIQTRIIDFGLAKPIESEDGPRGFRSDVIEIIRKFTALYLDEEFDSPTDVSKNWKEKLSQMADAHALSEGDRTELFCLIDSALQVISPSDVPKFQQELAGRINFDAQSLSRKVAKILFPSTVVRLEGPYPGNKTQKTAPSGSSYSQMDFGDTFDGNEDFFASDDIDDNFLDNLRKQTGIGCH